MEIVSVDPAPCHPMSLFSGKSCQYLTEYRAAGAPIKGPIRFRMLKNHFQELVSVALTMKRAQYAAKFGLVTAS